MECDLLGGHSMEESLANSKGKMDSAVRDIYLSLTSAICKTFSNNCIFIPKAIPQ